METSLIYPLHQHAWRLLRRLVKAMLLALRWTVVLLSVWLTVNGVPQSLAAQTQSLAVQATASDKLLIEMVYLQYQPERPPVLSNILPEPEDLGSRGAELGIADNNSTGRFLKQDYRLHTVVETELEPLLVKAEALYQQDQRFFITRLPAQALQQLSARLGPEVLIFNAGSSDDALRSQLCLPGVLHTLPSYAMKADALAQWAVSRNWKKWLLIQGSRPEDVAFATALKRSVQRFGLQLVAEKTWDYDTDLRRSAQTELVRFTQTDEYDLVVLADESGDFGEYVLYNTWLPRPVAGTQGLRPLGWHRVVEQWGAAQLQNRFIKLAGRDMQEQDYAAWVAARALSEAVIQLKLKQPEQLQPAVIRKLLVDEHFELAAFQGRKLNFRPWSGQLRQPIPLVHPRALVSQSPQEGFLHPRTELDTLGFDQPEVQCGANG
ncbi:ABC transporter substrate-binding protein [Balneatrix alpica]|uniref:ABC transporter substrate-binding protein n=1 Tax=Balneatrix alpica TaxID=75684 RepID=UPI002738D81C|nr:ABC transporter substrate-binding protein [Balneatrix alpica]